MKSSDKPLKQKEQQDASTTPSTGELFIPKTVEEFRAWAKKASEALAQGLNQSVAKK
jgi:hypothetical protein